MDSKSPEQQLAEFLAAKPSWLRKFLQLDYTLTSEEKTDMESVNWPVVYGDARDEYLALLARCPERLREHRKQERRLAVQSALRDLPSGKPGRPREDALAHEAKHLEHAGNNLSEIADELNRRHPDRRDLKGNLKPVTPEAVRKMLRHAREGVPDKT